MTERTFTPAERERIYDEEIAPELAKLAARCKSVGMSLIARCDWEPNSGGSTICLNIQTSGVAAGMTAFAALSNGNVDQFCLNMIEQFDTSQSLFLAAYSKRATASGDR